MLILRHASAGIAVDGFARRRSLTVPTNKQKVLKRYPKAYSVQWADTRTWGVYKPQRSEPLHDLIGVGYTPANAWLDAWRRCNAKR